MATVKRYDRGELQKPLRMPNGWMKVEARMSRTGVQSYLNPDGSIRRELRLPEEVFNRDALESFSLVPVTDEHPPVFLDATNTKDFTSGAVGEGLQQDGDFVRGPLLITDGDLIGKLEKGDAREVSCGYTCDLEERSGEYRGERYDCIQRNIRGNHVAIVPRGRAGPDVRVRMDAAASAVLSIAATGGGALSDQPPSQEKPVAHKTRIDGIDVEVVSEKDAQLIEKTLKSNVDALSAKDAKIAELEKAVAKEAARADAEAEKVKKLDADLKAAPEKVRAELKGRMDLEQQARKILGKEAKLDGLTDRQVKEKVLAKSAPTLKLEGKADAYVDARFEIAIEKADDAKENEDEVDGEEALANARRAAEGENTDDDSDDSGSTGDAHLDADKAYEKMVKYNQNRWKAPQAQ